MRPDPPPPPGASSPIPSAAVQADIRQALSGFGEEWRRLSGQISAAYSRPDIAKLFRELAADLKTLPERLNRVWSIAVENGWYPNAETTANIAAEIERGPATLDAFMVEHLRADWKNLTASILDTHPERADILRCAFRLHADEEYIAAIPLFISQAEGILADTFHFSIFMDKNAKSDKVSELTLDAEWFDRILIGLVGLNTQLHAGSSSRSPEKKAKAPSRNGILHGSRHHLDYGTRVNSFKAFSLLAYASFLAKSQTESADTGSTG